MWSQFAFFGPPCQPQNGPEPPCQDGVHVHSYTNNLTSIPSAIPVELHNRTGPAPYGTLSYRYCATSRAPCDLVSRTTALIHLSFDLWTSPNYKAILAVVGHWTTSEYKKETATLGMRELLKEHEGVNIAPLLYEVVKEYEIEDKLGWFMADNPGSNDTALRALDKILQEKGFEGFNPEERRLRCLGHIVNLAVKLLLVIVAGRRGQGLRLGITR